MNTSSIFAALRRAAIASVCVATVSGCSVKKMAINSMANALSSSGDTFAADDDPELVRDAVPFALKTFESLLETVPKHKGLLLATCSGFTQYSYAFLQTEADVIESEDYERAKALRERALKLYVRARDYCLRGLELRFSGIGGRLPDDPKAALARAAVEDVPILYWTGASWGAAISLGIDQPELAADFPVVRALIDRALELDEDYQKGAIHEMLIALYSVPAALGGSEEAARKHFARAVQLQDGLSAGPYVALAMGVSVANQNRSEFETLMKQALAVDPQKERSTRLANIITQRRARKLLERADDLFAK